MTILSAFSTGLTLVFNPCWSPSCYWILSHVCLFLQIKALLISSCCFFLNSGTVQGLSCWETFFTYFTDKIDQFQEFSNSVGAMWKVFAFCLPHTHPCQSFQSGSIITLSPSFEKMIAFLKNGKMWLLVTEKNISIHKGRKVANIIYTCAFWCFNNIGLECKIINHEQVLKNATQISVESELLREFAVNAEWHCRTGSCWYRFGILRWLPFLTKHNHLSTSSKLHSQEKPWKISKDWDLNRKRVGWQKPLKIAGHLHDTGM